VIDTHCHLLPGLDDGPKTMEEAITLAGDLVGDGVSSVVCTPHYSRAFPTDHEQALALLEELRSALGEARLALDLHLGAEIAPALVVSAALAELRRRSIRGRYLVIEVLRDSPSTLLELAARRAREGGLTPIFAHPERCRALQRHPTLIEEARAEGALVQVVAPSLLGRWGRGVAAAAWSLVGAGWVDLLGSDAHGSRRRRVHLAEAVELIAERVGEDVTRTLVETNPARILGTADAAAH
jgi:protein-tyrosine phosphatase